MKKTKGGNKLFSQYLASEYEDISLTPLKPTKSNISKFEYMSKLNSKHLSDSNKPHNTPLNSSPKTTNQYNMHRPTVRLDSDQIRRCTGQLSSDAEKCEYGLCEFKHAPNLVYNEAFRDLYKKLETQPVLFLSISYDEISKKKIEAVYFWQINRKTPFPRSVDSDYIGVDLKNIGDSHINAPSSLLLLAKIVPEQHEKITEARILGDDRLLVKSLDLESKEIVIRVYEVTRLFNTVRINPYRYEILANENYSYKFRVNAEVKEENTELTIRLWYRRELEDLDLSTSIIEGNRNGNSIRLLNTDVLISTNTIALPFRDVNIKYFDLALNIVSDLPDDWILFQDKKMSLFFFWRGQEVRLITFNAINNIHSMKGINGCFLILDQVGQFYELQLDPQHGWKVTPINHTVTDLMPENFEFYLFQLENCSLAFERTKFIVYFYQRKFHSVQLEKESTCNTVLLDLSEKIQHDDDKIPWSTYQHQDRISKSLIVYFLEGSVHFYEPETKREKSVKIFLDPSQNNGKWKILPTSDYIVYLYDLVVKNLVVVIHTERSLDTFFSQGCTPSLEFIRTFGMSKEIIEKREWNLQVGGPEDKILLIPRESGSLYIDTANKVYLQGRIQASPLKEEKLPVNGDGDQEEIEMRAREAEIKRELLKSRKKIQYLQGQGLILEESRKVLDMIRQNINRVIQLIENYERRFKEYQDEKNGSEKRGKLPKEVATKDDLKEYLDLYKRVKEIKRREQKHREKQKYRNQKDRYIFSRFSM